MALLINSFSLTFIANCTVPSEPGNGRISAFHTDGSVLDYGQLNVTVLAFTQLHYLCDKQFTLIGPSTITCTTEGQWNSDPENIMCLGINFIYNYIHELSN